MNNNFKKPLFWIVLVLSVCLFTILASCSSCDNESGSDDSDLPFTLNYHLKSLSLYDTLQLNVNGYEDVVWSSDNESIASVNDGLVTANSFGSATIIVKKGNLTDTCIVNVLNENIVPYVKVNVDDTGLGVLVGDEYCLKCVVRFNNKDYTDGVFKFLSSDESVVTITESGVVHAKEIGDATITVKGNWRGFDSKQLTIDLPVSVNPDLTMNLSIENEEIFTRSCIIDNVNYSNTTKLSYSIMIDGQDKTTSTEVVWKVLDSNVVSLNGATVTAKNRGQTEIYYECSLNGKTYSSLSVSVAVNAPLKSIDEPVIYEIGNGCIPNSIFEGTPYSVKFKTTDYTEKSEFDSDGIRIDSDSQNGFKGSEMTFAIDTEVYSYSVNVIFVTHAISTKDKFVSFLNSYSGNKSNVENNMSNTYYAVLTTDIDLTGVILPSKSYNNDRFFGRFNGLGHYIKNPTVNASGGIFGGLQNCTIENLAIDGVNITQTYASYAILAGYLYPGAKVSNVYVNANIEQLTFYRGLFYNQTNGTLSNIVARLTYGSNNNAENKYVFGLSDIYNKTSHIYAIGNATAYCGIFDESSNSYVPYTQQIVYSDAEAFFSANCDDFISDNGFTKYWVKTDNSLKFGKLTIYSSKHEESVILPEKEINELLVYKIGTDCIPNSLFEGNPKTIKINATDYSESSQFNSDGIYVDADVQNNFKGIETAFIIETDICSYAVNVLFVTHAISTKDEFISFLNSYSGNNSNVENNMSNTYYAVLTKDIDLTGVILPSKAYNNDRFFGQFNGLGHCIKNPTVNATGGIFGGLQDCTIENLAIDGVNITSNSGYRAILAGYIYPGANVSNVYVKATISQPSVFRGLFFNMQFGTISNIVADITYSGSSTVDKFVFGVYDGGEPTGREQIYGIGNAAGYLGVWDAQANNYVLEEGGTIYSNAEAFFDANRDVVSAENGFSKYWVKTENSLKFGELTIYSN